MNLAIPPAENEESPNQIKSIDLDRFGSIRGQDCRVGLKEIGFRSLSLREGSFQHGDVLEWDSKYAKNKRISTLYAKRDPVVTVLALATNNEGFSKPLLFKKNPPKKGVMFLLRAKMSL